MADCCPKGYFYIFSPGYYTLAGNNVYITNPAPLTDFFGKCVQIVNNNWALLPLDPVDPVDCPCCPDGYYYNNLLDKCVSFLNASTLLSTIPCIDCDCTQAEERVCEDCKAQNGLPISFIFDPTVKQCTDCGSLQGPRMTNDCYFNNFMPYFMVDPIINFKRR